MRAVPPPGATADASDTDARDEVRALLRWAAGDGVGPRRLRAAVVRAGSARALLGRSDAAELLGAAGVVPGSTETAERILDRCAASNVRTLGWAEAAYPPGLLNLDDPPPVLFVRGSIPPPNQPAVAIVGSRAASGYGRRVARSLSRGLARHGVPVISGLALGVDGEAHAGALEGGGATWAVLGGGVEKARPATHRRLYGALLAARGGVVGEWPPGTPARAFHFPRRNRILAALAQVVVVVEAGIESGALSTAAHARRLGREVTAVPGPVDRPGHAGSNRLIRDGAAPVLEVRDLLDRVGVLEGMVPVPPAAPRLEGDAAPVWRSLADGPAGVEALAGRTGLPPHRVLGVLTRLEVEGWVRRERGLHARADGGGSPS